MSYGELLRLYFDRSNALQWYWTLYVVIIGGLLAFSSLRQRPDLLTVILVTVLYCLFAYKNLGAIRDATRQRTAVVESIKELHSAGRDTYEAQLAGRHIEPTLETPDESGIRNFHLASDALTLAAVWAMEWRRWRKPRTAPANEEMR